MLAVIFSVVARFENLIIVAVLYCRYTQTIDASGIELHDVLFEYTATTTIPIDQRRVVGVFDQATGVVVAADCSSLMTAAAAGSTTNYSVLPTCAFEYVPRPHNADCGFPGDCLTGTGCCGPALILPIPALGCEYGLQCSGNFSSVNATIATQPNSRVLCSADWCGCDVASSGSSGSSSCVDTVGESICFYNRELCYTTCGGSSSGDHSRQHYTLGPGSVLKPLVSEYTGGNPVPPFYQDWQYYSGPTQTWYPIRDSYFSNVDGQKVSFVRGVGYGQYVWTVRIPDCSVNLTSLLDPSGLVVEARILGVHAEQTDPLDTITVVYDDDTSRLVRDLLCVCDCEHGLLAVFCEHGLLAVFCQHRRVQLI